MSKYNYINNLLSTFDHYQYLVDSKKRSVNLFLDRLKAEIKFDDLLSGSYFIRTGSSYEKTVVRKDADFDVILILPTPFRMENFKMVEVEGERGILKLKYTANLKKPQVEKFLDKDNFLLVEELRIAVFHKLIGAVKNISPSIIWRKLRSSFRITVNELYKDDFRMDVVPQIGVSCMNGDVPGWNNSNIPQMIGDIPGWNNSNIPQALCKYIKYNKYQTFFNLSYPPWLKDKEYKHLFVQATFNMLEKQCMISSDLVRNSVRLVKAVAKDNDWIKRGLRCFHIKRVAIQNFDRLENCSDPLDGYNLILYELSSMLKKGYIDGFFVKGQKLISKSKEDFYKLANEIDLQMYKISILINYIGTLLSTYIVLGGKGKV